MAAVFIDPCSLAVGAYEILQFLVVECMLLILHSAVGLRDSLLGCWGDQCCLCFVEEC